MVIALDIVSSSFKNGTTPPTEKDHRNSAQRDVLRRYRELKAEGLRMNLVAYSTLMDAQAPRPTRSVC